MWRHNFYAILGGEGVGNASAVKGRQGMTIRQMIDEKLRKIMIVILSGIIISISGIAFNAVTDLKIASIIFIVGFAIVVFALFYAYFFMYCPNCNTVIGYVVMYKVPFMRTSILTMSKAVKYCPFCGINLDAEFNGIHAPS